MTVSMQKDKSYAANQADVWADISAKAARMGAHSPTGAMERFTDHADFTERCVEQLRPVERQCGALFLIDGVLIGLDPFDSAIRIVVCYRSSFAVSRWTRSTARRSSS